MGGGWVGVENSLSILDSQTTLVGDKYALTGKWLWSYSLLIIIISLVLNFNKKWQIFSLDLKINIKNLKMMSRSSGSSGSSG